MSTAKKEETPSSSQSPGNGGGGANPGTSSTPGEPPQETQSQESQKRISLPIDPLAQFRTININSPQSEVFPGNSISTAKYSLISFIPSFLFEQFRRYSNIFFLVIACIQQIPDISPTGRYTILVPLLLILSVSAVKEIIEDIKRHKGDAEINKRDVEILRDGFWRFMRWSDVSVGDFIKVGRDKPFPADLILFSSSEPQGVCYIETSNLDGETNLKIRQALPRTASLLEAQDFLDLSGSLECQLPNRNLYEFVGRLKFDDEEDLAVGPDQVLLRGSKLQNTGYIHGLVVYSGHETKLMKNSTVPPLKRSTVDKKTNSKVIILFIILILVSVTSALFSVFYIDHSEVGIYIRNLRGLDRASAWEKTKEVFFRILTFIILYNNLIPISLTVTLEVVRFIQALYINWDADMYDVESHIPATARTSNLNEELGQVSYIFSDKTGTLTRNIMEFKACSVFGKIYKLEDLTGAHNLLAEDMISGQDPNQKYDIREFLVLLAVCHTVIPDYTNGEGIENVIYHAASPDERALVYGAMQMGFAFLSRTPTSVTISALGNEEKYEIVNVLDFSSARKRMSVVVRGPDGKLKLYCKGADTMIFERLKKSSSRLSLQQKTAEHLEEFSKQGLRTLCCAVTEISPEMHKKWEKTFHKAATALQDREAKLDAAAELIEKNLRLVGSTAIEDKLQDQVPETIAAFMEAGISVWVLTGDKQETAIEIGYSCQLLKQDMQLLIVNRDSLRKTRECVKECQEKVYKAKQNTDGTPKDFQGHVNCAVIIDGKTLQYALNPELRTEFLEMCCQCKAVIVCRASPLQKAEIVENVTTLTGAITLAIGDGANDVAMIQKAHVGVGISGQEGLQAACASDYAIAQFRHLRKLLFVHGAWNYDRMCKVIFYSFYKNMCLYIIELWFAIYSAWSGQIIYEKWTIGLYNMLFTAAQPIAIGAFERNINQEMRLNYPKLYAPSSSSFSLKMFCIWLLNSLMHSAMIFWITWHLYGSGIVWGAGHKWGGLEGGYLVLGNFIYTYVVAVVSLKSGLITTSWTVFSHISIWGSILFWILFLLLYSYFCAISSRFTLGADICGVAYMVYTSPVFWIGLIVVPVATLLPDLIVKALRTTVHQGLDDAFRECEVFNKDPDVMLKDREKHKGNGDSLEDIYRACLTCDSLSFLAKYNCCCVKKGHKKSPLLESYAGGGAERPVTRSGPSGDSESDHPNLETGTNTTAVEDSDTSFVSSDAVSKTTTGAKKKGVKKRKKPAVNTSESSATTASSKT